MTENTGAMDVGKGVLWRSKVEPTCFKFYANDPVYGHVAMGARLKIQGRDGLVSVPQKSIAARSRKSNRATTGTSTPAAIRSSPVRYLC
jgi:hypothetical protein